MESTSAQAEAQGTRKSSLSHKAAGGDGGGVEDGGSLPPQQGGDGGGLPPQQGGARGQRPRIGGNSIGEGARGHPGREHYADQ